MFNFRLSDKMERMDGLPADIDLKPIIGREVTMVRLGKFQLHYLLSDEKPTRPDAWIEIESNDLTFTDASGNATKISDFIQGAGQLCLLVGLKIEKATRKDDGGLHLNMSTGIQLDINIHTSMYESVVLHVGEDATVG